jgi:hypothetical protein
MVDVSTYVPPGVYVQDISQDIVVPLAPGLTQNLLCIVAPAIGYQSVTENIPVFSLLATALTNPGVVDGSLVLTTLTGTPLVEGTDYSVSTAVVNSVTVTSITRLPSNPLTASPAGVTDGQLIQVSYHFVDANYYNPQLFTEYNSLASVYGPAFSSDPAAADPVISPLTMGAKIAFENGAGAILAVAVATPGSPDSTTWRAAFAAAYGLLVTDHRVSVMVPIVPDSYINTGSGVVDFATDLREHCDAAAANGYGREVLLGAASSFDDSAYAYETIAQTTANKRIVSIYPFRFNLYNPLTAQFVEVGGKFAAAALGGRLVYNSVEQSLTRQAVASFDSLPASVQQKMTTAFKNNLSANGVLVIETDRLDRLVVRHAVTTDPTALNTREISLVRISDVLTQDIEVGLENSGLIGQPIDVTMAMRVKGALIGILEQEVLNSVIVSYIQVLVSQQQLPNGDPSVIECQFAYQPAVPLNYIRVQFALNLTTGALVDPALTTLS